MNYEVVIASTNQHKVDEFRRLLSPHKITVYGVKDLNIEMPNVNENGKTYYDNALIKAKALSHLIHFPIIADDSGLEVKALNNKPGLYTARFAKEKGGFLKAMGVIISAVEGKERDARFVCDLAFINNNEVLRFEGVSEGKISEEIKGQEGFGFDPIFIPTSHQKTFGEMENKEKDLLSHRGRAIKKLLTYLKINQLI